MKQKSAELEQQCSDLTKQLKSEQQKVPAFEYSLQSTMPQQHMLLLLSAALYAPIIPSSSISILSIML